MPPYVVAPSISGFDRPNQPYHIVYATIIMMEMITIIYLVKRYLSLTTGNRLKHVRILEVL